MPHTLAMDTYDGSIDRMEALMASAAAIIRGGGGVASLATLKPMRLQMAGAITSCQLALDRIASGATSSQPEVDGARRASRIWADLGREFRDFTMLNQSSTPQAWGDYAIDARAFMVRIRRQIDAGRI